MSSDTTPSTWNFNFRATTKERAIVQRVVDAHKAMGLNISLNQALLVIIHRAATPDADTEEEARKAIEQHWATCPYGCHNGRGASCIKCPEGWRLRDAYTRVAYPRRRPLPHPSPTVEQPPAVLEQPPTAAALEEPTDNRPAGMLRALFTGKQAS